MPSRFLRALAGSVLALIFAGPALAQSSPPVQALSLREALARVIAHNPRLAAFAPARDAAQNRAALDALAPAMNLDVQLENFAGTGNTSGIDALETTLQLSRVIELGGKAQLRRAFGDAELEQLEARQHADRIDLLAESARRFVHVLADQETLDATRRAVDLAAGTLAAVQARVKAGAASPAANSRAEISLARARIEHEHSEHELASSRVALAVLWGEERADFTAVSGSFYSLRALEPLEAHAARLAQNPEVLRLASDHRLLAARERLNQAQRRPSPLVSLGVRRLEAFNDQALVAGFSLPLGTRQRASLESAATKADLRELEYSQAARQLELGALLFALYQEITHARTETEAIAEHIRPEATRLLKAVEDGYRAGRFSLIELADAQRQLLEIERDQIRAATEFHNNLIEIERITGVSLPPAAQGPSP
jgi:cobalt-zinc-cadmium efflux system outer membrane protein